MHVSKYQYANFQINYEINKAIFMTVTFSISENLKKHLFQIVKQNVGLFSHDMLLFQGLIVVYLVAVVLLVRRQIYQVKVHPMLSFSLVVL